MLGGRKGGGTGATDVGRIRWLRWTTREAVGIAVVWSRCLNVGGCKTSYTPEHDTLRIRLSAPVAGHFTRIAFQGGGEFRLERFPPTHGYFWTN